jgi:cysteine desulfurase / selenocysteine lyase
LTKESNAMSVKDGFYPEDFGPFHGRVWMNTAHQGPLPKVAARAAEAALSQRIRPSEIHDEDFFDGPKRLRHVLGRLIDAAPEDIILGNSTSYGLNLLANGIRWNAGDEILLVDGDFPADVYSWFPARERGVTIRLCKANGPAINAEELATEISPRTRLFCCSWVNSFTGHSLDIAAIGEVCRQAGVWFVLNASQGLGAGVLHVKGLPIDAITCCGYKWLCGPYSTGFCWLMPALRETLLPLHAYWLPMQAGKPLDQMRDYTFRSDLGARAWDVFCTANFLNFRPWTASVEYIVDADPERVAAYDQQLIERFIKGLDRERYELVSPESHSLRSTLVVLRPVGGIDTSQLLDRLAHAGIDVALREGNLRVSPHLHNTTADIDRVLDVLHR